MRCFIDSALEYTRFDMSATWPLSLLYNIDTVDMAVFYSLSNSKPQVPRRVSNVQIDPLVAWVTRMALAFALLIQTRRFLCQMLAHLQNIELDDISPAFLGRPF